MMEVQLHIKIVLIFLIISSKFSVSSHELMFHAIERSSADMERGLTHPYHETCKVM